MSVGFPSGPSNIVRSFSSLPILSSESPYAFVENDPVNSRDPTGMMRTGGPWKAGYSVRVWSAYWEWLESLTRVTYNWMCILEWANYGTLVYYAGGGLPGAGGATCVACVIAVGVVIASIGPAVFGVGIPLLVAAVASAVLSCVPCIAWLLDNAGMLNPPSCKPITYKSLFP